MTSRNKKSALDDIWPQERDIIEKPERFKYVRKIIKPKSCVFCEAKQKTISSKSLVVYKNKKVLVVLNKYPYNTGHLLILPTEHVSNLSDISESTFIELMLLLKNSVKLIEEVYSCAGINVGLNMGEVAGAGIPGHIHWHVIPRWKGDTNFFPLIAETKVLPETLAQSYKKIREKFKEVK